MVGNINLRIVSRQVTVDAMGQLKCPIESMCQEKNRRLRTNPAEYLKDPHV